MTQLRPFPVPCNDNARGLVIDAMDLKRRENDPFFERVIGMTRRIFDAPVAFLSLIQGDVQSFLRIDGIELDGTPRCLSLCAFTVAKKQTIIIPDTHLDARSQDHPIVANAPHLRFSVSAPVILSTGFCLGTLCAVDMVPHDAPTDEQVAMLEDLAAMVARFYEVPIEPDPAHKNTLRAIAEEAQNEFLSLVSHELRTPLNGIQGLSELLEGRDEDEVELLDALRASTSHLGDIVENILTFTEMRTGDMVVDERPFSLADVIGRVVLAFDKLARVQGKTLRVTGADDPFRITGDAAKLELALSCIVANFIYHGGAHGELSLRMREDGGLTITLGDDGAGISEERQAAIWGAFSVGASVLTRKSDGIGLGLPLSSRIVDLHGGELALASAPGTTLARVHLPAWRSVTA